LTVTGENGESSTCPATVTIVDEIDPIAKCVNPFTIQLDSNGEASITESDINNNSTDNCGIVSSTLSQYNFTRADVGKNDIILTITDVSGRTNKCSVQVTIEDNNAPEAKCKPITLALDENGNTTLTAEEVYDGDANADKVTLQIDQTSFNCSHRGDNTVTLTITGEDGKSSTCQVIATVEDNIAPSITCPGDQNETFNSQNGFILPEYLSLSQSSDNCFVVSKTQTPAAGTIIYENTEINLEILIVVLFNYF
jgi:hypothetical protein